MSELKNLRPDLPSIDKISELKDPFFIFEEWMNHAISEKILQPNAMCLSTFDSELGVTSRVVLLKEIKNNELYFFSNYTSDKAESIKKNNQVALNFLWMQLNKQIKILGKVKKISREESVEYFNSRPFESRVAALSSNQSEVFQDRSKLVQKFEENLKLKEIVCPEHWGGYKISPHHFEFWTGHKNRLHDRLCFDLKNNIWNSYRKNP